MRNLFTYIAFALLVAIASPAMGQQVPEPGTSINNTALSRYFFPILDDSVDVSSNTVSAIIQETEKLNLFPDHRTQTRKGQRIGFVHQLVNTGNVPTNVIITGTNTSGDDYDLNNIVLSEGGETSADNVVNIKTATASAAGDQLTVTLQPGETFNFTVAVAVPNEANAGDLGNVRVQAKTQSGTIILDNTDIIEVLEGPVIDVIKEVAKSTGQQGGEITYLIRGSNKGDQTARTLNLTVDGNPIQKVLLRDPIPANTTFARVEDDGNGLALYHIAGDPEFEFSTQPSENLSQVDQFAVAYDSLEPGQEFDARFTVHINANAAGRIKNVARVDYNDPVDGDEGTSDAETNLVQEVLPEYKAELDYYNNSYSSVRKATRLGSPLLLQANAAACNISSAVRDTSVITLQSTLTGDVEVFNAIETGINTGFFRVVPNVPMADASKVTVVKNNGTVETLGDDVIKAVLASCGENQEPATAQILVAPYGVIFNSETDEPVANVKITLIDVTGQGNGGNAGAPAMVYDEEGTHEIDNTQITGANGEFEYPYVKPSTYRISVEPPAGWRFASIVSPSDLPGSRNINTQGSYGNDFTITGSPGPIAFDVPVDPATEGALFIEKTSSTASAEIGDFVSYKITISNNGQSTVPQVRVEDTLPFGFRYEQGTALLDGKSIADPDGGKGPSLSFNIGDMPGNSSVTLTYRVLLGTGARNGDGTNTAIALSDQGITLQSNEARNTIEIRGGVFTDKGYIIGKVFADLNENDVQDAGEPGVPGVRIYLENGSFVITDSEGKYTFYGIIPNKHVLKVDNYSLPVGSRLGELDNRHAGDPSSRFVDLKKGELHRADFAICDLTPAARREIEERRAAFNDEVTGEVENSIKRNFSAKDNTSNRVVRRAEASGVIDGNELPSFKKEQKAPSAPGTLKNVASATGDSIAVADTPAAQTITLEEAMVHASTDLDFMKLHDQDTLNIAQTNVWVKGTLGTTLLLKVNGKEIGGERISKKSTLAPTNLQAYEYIGLNLNAGANTLTVSETDPFGNERGSKQITVYAPGRVEKIKLTVPVNDVSADGVSTAIIRVSLLDESGVEVKSRIPITLDTSIGEWLIKDLDPATPGTQIYIEKGHADFELKSPIEPQDANVRVSVGVMKEEAVVSFLPDLRPLIAAGIIEGTIRLNEGASMVPARSADGFERELKTLSYTRDDITADTRAAFFLKGKIKGDLLLTAGFDSEKDDDRLFRDIQPDEFYPVYGESSVKGYDAQSTGRLYVRVDHKKTYALYGDFITQERSPAKSLGEYNRTQTGIKLHYEKDWARVNVFGSQASSLQRIEEFRGQGLSGPYRLKYDNILINSEQIEIIKRDRNQPSIIISRERLTRFRDYVVEPFTGKIIFKSPVPSLDEDLNPIFIRVTYEVEGGAKDYLIGGADGQVKLTDFFEVGGSFVEDRNPEDKYRLKSVNTTLRLGENTVLIGEGAESTTDSEGTGQGGRVELQHRGQNTDLRLYAGQTDKDFVNRSSQLGQGRTEAGARGRVKLTSTTNLKGEFIYSSNDTLHTNTTGGLLNIDQQITDRIHAEVGVRYSKQNQAQIATPGSEDITNKNIRGKLTVGVPKVEGASVFGEYEQDINQSDRKLIAVGGDYKLKGRGKIYARHEFISSALGQYTLNGSERRQNTVVGLDADYMQNGQVYSEYRVDDAFDGANAQAAIGLRNRFEIYEGFGINAGLERVFSISGDPLNEGTAISTSVDYTANPLWKGTARAEARFSNNGNTYLNTLGYGRKIDPNWTFLGKNIFSLETSSNAGTENRIQQRLRFGFAYRETDKNRFDALGRYELKYEENGQFGGDYSRLVHIFSTNVNYHPGANATYSARLAAKKVGESSAEFDSESLTMLLSARSIHDITRKLDGGINASIMSNAGFDSKDYGLGVELGYIVQRNLRLAVGFNVFGFEDRDLAASNYTRKGVYLGFSYKFDERLFSGLIPDEDKHPEIYAKCQACIETKKDVEMLKMPEPELAFKGLQPVTIEPRAFDYKNLKGLTKLPKDIHFATDKNIISDASKEMLDLVAGFLKGQQQFKLEITGHTDSRASYNYNLGLSKRRAEAVEHYLVSKGVNANLVSFKGLSEGTSEAAAEADVIDRSMNRKVELNLDISNMNVRFIPQINDLQVDKRISKSIPEWDYIFNTKINAVPDRIYINGSKLSAPTKYLLNRVVMAMHYYPAEKAVLKVGGPQKVQQKEMLVSFLQQAGADMSRIDVQLISGSSHGVIAINFGTASEFKIIPQRDDELLANSTAIQPVLSKLLELLKLRQDYLLITTKSE